ncbi:hypothetical protein BI335_11665 [Enemella evansiae]|nr:hypothetical protein BI335_11665 [Enemella evansiae]
MPSSTGCPRWSAPSPNDAAAVPRGPRRRPSAPPARSGPSAPSATIPISTAPGSPTGPGASPGTELDAVLAPGWQTGASTASTPGGSMSSPRPPSATSDRTVWWGFGVLTVVLIASLVGFTLLPATPAPAGAGAGQQAGRAGGGASPDASPSPTPSPTPTPPTLTDPTDSPLYRLELNVVACPGFTERTDRVPAGELRGYLQTVLDCLVASNREALERAGLPTVAPTLAEEGEMASSPCGAAEEQQNWAAAYCGGNQVIYYHADWQEQHGPYVGVIAHEYAHHLQLVTGLLEINHEQRQATQGQPNGKIKENELTRRNELQAQCVAGALLNGDWSPLRSRVGYQEFIDGTRSMDPQGASTHGTGRANNRWIAAGGTSTGPMYYKACNTYSAPADQVE